MAAKVYEIAFKLAGKLSSDFSGAFKEATKTVDAYGEEIQELNKELSQVDHVMKLRKETTKVSQAFNVAQKNVTELGKSFQISKRQTAQLTDEFQASQAETDQLQKAIKSIKKPSDELVRAFENSRLKTNMLSRALKDAQIDTKKLGKTFDAERVSVKKAEKSLLEKRIELQKAERAYGTAGKKVQDLIRHQDNLTKSADRARDAQKKLLGINEKIAKIDTMNENAKAQAGAGMAQVGAVGAGMGAAAGLFVKGGNDYVVALNRMQAQTGATDAEMQEMSESARDLYKSGLGETFDEVTNAMVKLHQVGGLSGKTLEDATGHALNLGRTFGYDINESTRAASALMKNFGISSTDAYGLIAYGAQNGADKNGDLLDVLNEYSVQYKTLGFTSEQFTQHLVAGAESGAFSVDKVGDALKEFNIRAKDGTKSSMEAFATLGINGTKATKMFAAGGEQANEAFFKTIKALNEMEDPVKKNAAGVALFGTMYEDLESGVLESFLSMEGASIDAAGTLSKIESVIGNDLATAISKVTRSFTDSMKPAAENAAKALTAKMPEIQESLAKLSPIIETIGKGFIENLPAIVNGIAAFAQKAVDFALFVKDNWSIIGPIVKTMAASFLLLKIGPAILSPVLLLAKGFMQVQKAVVLMKNSAVLASLALKAKGLAMMALKGIGTIVTTTIKLMRGAFTLLSAAMRATPIGIVISLMTLLVAAGVWVYKNWDTLKAKAIELWDNFKETFPNLAGIVEDKFGLIKDIAMDVWGVFKNLIGFITNVFTGEWSAAWENVKGIFGGIFDSLVGLVKLPFNSIIALINGVIGSINGISVDIPSWVPKYGGQTFGVNIPTIPQLASGGIATKPTLAMIGEGRESEAVLPLSRLDGMLGGSSSSNNVSVNFAPVINLSGSTDAYADVKRGLDESQKNLKRELQSLLKNERRLSYV